MLTSNFTNTFTNAFTTPWNCLPFGGVSPVNTLNPYLNCTTPFNCTPYGMPFNSLPFNTQPFNTTPFNCGPIGCPPVSAFPGFGQGFGFGGGFNGFNGLGGGFGGGFGLPYGQQFTQSFANPINCALPFNSLWGQNSLLNSFCGPMGCPVPGVNAYGLGVNPINSINPFTSPINTINPLVNPVSTINPLVNPISAINPLACGPIGCSPLSCLPYNCLPTNSFPFNTINPLVSPIGGLPFVTPSLGLPHPSIVGTPSSIYNTLTNPTSTLSNIPFGGVNPFVSPIHSTLNSIAGWTNFNTPWNCFGNISPLTPFTSVPFGGLNTPHWGLGLNNPYLFNHLLTQNMVNPYLFAQTPGLYGQVPGVYGQIPGVHTPNYTSQNIKTHNGVVTPNGVNTTVPFPGAYNPTNGFPFPVAPFNTPVHGSVTGYSPAYTPAVAGVGCEIA